MYQPAMRGAEAELLVTGNGHFLADLVGVDLHKLWLQRRTDTLPPTG
jgi:hypothetical protein